VNVKIITDVTTEPITTAEAKSHLRVDITDDNDYIDSLVTVARLYCENYTRRALAEKTIELIMDKFPDCKDYFELPYALVSSVTHIKYKNSDGDESTWDTANYIVDNDVVPARISLAYNVSYPTFTEYPVSAVRVRYVCGYNDSIVIPKPIKQAMLLLIGHWYENREATAFNVNRELAFSVNALLYPYKVLGW
jgi:uncharacterized phiE125 gp8 family phage protein